MSLFRPKFNSVKTGEKKEAKVWWYKFHWRGELIRESSKQTNKRVAAQIEAARKTALAKGEVGLRDRKPIPLLREFAEGEFLSYIESQFQNKLQTQAYYRNGIKNIVACVPLASARLDSVTPALVSDFISERREAGLQVSSINRQLEVLRRIFKLAVEWESVDKVPPRVRMLPGSRHRDFVLNPDSESAYLEAATQLGEKSLTAYEDALEGIRAVQRGEKPIRPTDPFVLRDAATLLLECALRPEELYRLRWEEVQDGAIRVLHGKTSSAKRTVPLTPTALAILEMRRASATNEWVFRASTKSGHAEQCTLKRQHYAACKMAGLSRIALYTFRHTCLTRWAASMDPYTLAYLAGHSDFSTTRRYVHPQAHTVLAAMERARSAQSGQRIDTSDKNAGDNP